MLNPKGYSPSHQRKHKQSSLVSAASCCWQLIVLKHKGADWRSFTQTHLPISERAAERKTCAKDQELMWV